MTRQPQPPRQPLFWGAVAFSLGLWVGVRAWRPPSWWTIALAAFVFAACWFLPKRAWLSKALSLAAWFLLGAFLIQIRGQGVVQSQDTRLYDLADGRLVTLTGRVIREGYARMAGPHWIRQSVDVETEEIASGGETRPVRAGVRLAIYAKAQNRPIDTPDHRVLLDDPIIRSPDPTYLRHAGAHSREAPSGAELPKSRRVRL